MLDCADGEVTMTENLSCSARFDTEAIFSGRLRDRRHIGVEFDDRRNVTIIRLDEPR